MCGQTRNETQVQINITNKIKENYSKMQREILPEPTCINIIH